MIKQENFDRLWHEIEEMEQDCKENINNWDGIDKKSHEICKAELYLLSYLADKMAEIS